MKMNIAIIGAGFGGLSAAKILKKFGYQVTVFEKEADVGGVWSASRRYPGLTTQNVKSTYCLSDFPYPDHYPEWPTGQQVVPTAAAFANRMEEIKSKFPNAWSAWSPEEDQKLIEEFNSGLKVRKLSESHGRTRGGIRSRLRKLELIKMDE